MTVEAKVLVATMSWISKDQLISSALIARLLGWISTHPAASVFRTHELRAALVDEDVLLTANLAGVIYVDLVTLNSSSCHVRHFPSYYKPRRRLL
jgi:hypothetical protein